jgi:PKD repeat protein
VGCAQPPTPGKGNRPTTAVDDTGAPADSGEAPRGLAASVVQDRTLGRIPLTVTFSVDVSEGAVAPVTAVWDLGEGGLDPVAAAEAVSHTWLGSGEQTVAVVVTDATGASVTLQAGVTALPDVCPEAVEPVQVGTLGEAELVEASGLAAGRARPDLLWVHNDSGDVARVFALDATGAPVGRVRAEGLPDGDWEDVATGPHPVTGGPALWVVDNSESGLQVHVFVEPDIAPGADVAAADLLTLDLSFPDGVERTADALAVDPVTGDLLLAVAGDSATIDLWRAADVPAGGPVTLARVAQVGLEGAPRALDFSPQGDRLLLRTADAAWLWLWDRNLDLSDVLSEAPCALPVPVEDDGEAAGFAADGSGVWSTSEGAAAPLHFTTLLPTPAPCDGAEVRIAADPASGPLPYAPTLTVDETCLPDGVASVTWDFGDGSPTTDAPTATHTWLASGTWTVTAHVVDGAGLDISGSLDVVAIPAECPAVGSVQTWGTIADAAIVEASGLVHSFAHAGVLWTHNDAGNDATLFAFGEDGRALGTFDVSAPARDWEDLATGYDPDRGAWMLYVGDIGDNSRSRSSVSVLVVEEPVVDPAGPAVTGTLAPVATLVLQYPDGASHNAETLLHDPATGDLLVVTKHASGNTGVYRKAAPHADGVTTLEHVADLVFGAGPLTGNGNTTAGAFSPLGDRIAIRTYTDLYLWRRDRSDTLAETFAGTPCDLYAPAEPQGEAVTWTTDGAGVLYVSEGDHPPLLYRSVSAY